MPYVGIMGGTFDPVHFGHLAAAEGVRQQLGLDRVLFMPNRQPPHKAGKPVSAAEHRATMVELAIAGNPGFGYTDLELRREGPSYTIDTIRSFHELHPDWRSAFLVGMDSLLEIQTWHDYPVLLTLTELVVVSRPGYSVEQRDAVIAALGPGLTGGIRLLEVPGVAISATELRRLAGEGRSLRYLVPDAVAGYIREHHLYG